MGREWYWGGRSSRRLSSGASFRFEGDNKNNHHAPAGCMSAVFDFFNFHHSHNLTTAHFIFNKQHHHHQQQKQPSFLSYHEYDPPLPKGVEAPRNSLELDEASLLSLFRKEETLHIPMGLKIKTRSNGGKKSKAREQGRLPNDRFSSESPSAKTPNLVARLMGLDILPQTSSPSSSLHVTPKHGVNHNVSGTRSLPESPRVSSARKSDVDHHRRLSLQINFNKENVGVSEEIEKGKERIRRKGLIDITNTKRNMKLDEEEVGFCPSKSENSSKRLKKTVDDDSSSRLRFLEPLSEILSTTRCTKEKTCHPSFQEVIFEKPIPKPKPEQKSFREHRQNERRICSKSQQEVEAFVCPAAAATKANINNKINEKSRKKTPLSKDLLNLNPPTLLSTKKDPKVPHEQPCHFPKGKQKHPTGEEAGERNTATATATDSGVSEFQYIIRILTSNGILMNSPVTKTFSPSNPLSLDPTIFHYLENDAVQDEPMCQNPNKKLIFDLVNELLGDILKTQMKKKKPWEWEEEEDNSIRKMQGWELAEKLWEKTEEFPRANCQVLEDIDALIDRDLTKSKFEFEFISTMEEIVKVVEIEILESLLRETAAIAFMAQPGVVLWSRGPIT